MVSEFWCSVVGGLWVGVWLWTAKNDHTSARAKQHKTQKVVAGSPPPLADPLHVRVPYHFL